MPSGNELTGGPSKTEPLIRGPAAAHIVAAMLAADPFTTRALALRSGRPFNSARDVLQGLLTQAPDFFLADGVEPSGGRGRPVKRWRLSERGRRELSAALEAFEAGYTRPARTNIDDLAAIEDLEDILARVLAVPTDDPIRRFAGIGAAKRYLGHAQQALAALKTHHAAAPSPRLRARMATATTQLQTLQTLNQQELALIERVIERIKDALIDRPDADPAQVEKQLDFTQTHDHAPDRPFAVTVGLLAAKADYDWSPHNAVSRWLMADSARAGRFGTRVAEAIPKLETLARLDAERWKPRLQACHRAVEQTPQILTERVLRDLSNWAESVAGRADIMVSGPWVQQLAQIYLPHQPPRVAAQETTGLPGFEAYLSNELAQDAAVPLGAFE